MKSLRRSLGDKTKDQSASPSSSSSAVGALSGSGGSSGSTAAGFVPSLSKPSASIQPPKKVIRAIDNHSSSSPSELPFVKGDFFYVVGEKDDPRGGPGFYEALNTISNARGLVLKSKFEEFGRGGAMPSSGSSAAAAAVAREPARSTQSLPASSKPPGKGLTQLYAVVQYDFVAERPDELEAKAGEPIIVIAHFNHEWFIAKPIGRLGGPGLIPVTFVEIRDPASGRIIDNIEEIIRTGAIPRVDEWKAKADEYKASSIPLGRFDFTNQQSTGTLQTDHTIHRGNGQEAWAQGGGVNQNQQQQQRQYQHHRQPSAASSASHTRLGSVDIRSQPAAGQASHIKHRPHPSVSESVLTDEDIPILPPGTFTSASVVSFHKEDEHYLFRIHAVFLPEDPSERATQLIVFRLYNDFYHFQISLLNTFLAEAGRAPDGTPHPPEQSTRILPLMPGPLEHVDDAITNTRREDLDDYVKKLIALHRIGAGYVLSDALVRTFLSPGVGDHQTGLQRSAAEMELQVERNLPPLLDEGLGGMGLVGRNERGNDDESRNGGHRRTPSQAQRSSYRPTSHRQSYLSAQQSSGLNTDSSSSSDPSYGGSTPSTIPPPINTSQTASRPESAEHSAGYYGLPTSSSWGSGPNPTTLSSLSTLTPSDPAPMAAPSVSAQMGPGAAQATAAYKKIKVFDRASDDVIAIRVPSSVTFDQLVEKVADRLGGGTRMLSYRDSMGLVPGSRGSGPGTVATKRLNNDQELRAWLDRTDKLMLYAD
ncbi:NADPH oxidase [Phaffia rhodozyma]|uniref:NADPH oxidase n=1 Tax=Phaffia rhodozyma TaxID=264483 RepID=A0A0F7SR79_PHARH|nr:NADPH oxidase [Phaffia rhodozyma]